MTRPRWITQFASRDGSTVVELPRGVYEWESSQSLRTAVVPALGSDYGVDLLGTIPAPVGVATERIRGLIVASDSADLDARVSALRAQLQGIGSGHLRATDGGGGYRWARARLASMPDVSITYEMRRHAPVVCEFTRYSDWLASSPTVVSNTLSGSPATVNVDNTGDADAREMVIEIRALGASGFSAPTVTNEMTGETLSSDRVASSSNHRLRFDCGRYAVERSINAGSSWANDYSHFTTGATQVGFMRLIPGSQPITITGCPNATVVITFYPAWR